MPLFDFICKDCGSAFEDLVPVGVFPPCPHCGSENIEKKVSCCARIKSGSNESFSDSSPSMSSGGCGGCAGGNCATCCR